MAKVIAGTKKTLKYKVNNQKVIQCLLRETAKTNHDIADNKKTARRK